MYRERLVATEARSESARRLQQLLLDYHDFRRLKAEHPLMEHAVSVADWQAERLKSTHEDLYRHPGYHHGLEFLCPNSGWGQGWGSSGKTIPVSSILPRARISVSDL